MNIIKEFLEDLMGRPMADPEPEFGGSPLPIEDQNGIVNWALFLIGALLFGVGVVEFCLPVMFIGAMLFGILLGRTR